MATIKMLRACFLFWYKRHRSYDSVRCKIKESARTTTNTNRILISLDCLRTCKCNMAIRGSKEVIFRGSGTESTVMMCVIAFDSSRMTSVAASMFPRNNPASIRFILAGGREVFEVLEAVADLVDTTDTGSILKK